MTKHAAAVAESEADEAIAELMEWMDAGGLGDVQRWLERYPNQQQELREFLQLAEAVQHLAGPTVLESLQAAGADSDDGHTGRTIPAPLNLHEPLPRMKSPRDGDAPPQLPARYRVVRLLGQGAMGRVWLADDLQLGRRVAIKLPRFARADSTAASRFLREAQAAAKLRHPHICPIFELGEHEGCPYIAMAFIEGRPLSAVIRHQPVSVVKAVALVRKLASALQAAHASGIVHRDLKPGNILIDERGEPIVMDFGLALVPRTNSDSGLTREGEIIGTPAYMAPEQIQPKPDGIGPHTDVYALGVILYELLAGRRPFDGDVLSVLDQVLRVDPAPLARIRPDIDVELAAICGRAMARNIAERYPSMEPFRLALNEYQRGRMAAASGTSKGALERDLSKSVPQSRSWVIAAVVGVVLLAGVLTMFLRSGDAVVRLDIDEALRRENVSVRIDGDTFAIDNLGETISLRPGLHEVEIRRGDLILQARQFSVVRNGKNVLEISVPEAPVVVQAAPAAPPRMTETILTSPVASAPPSSAVLVIDDVPPAVSAASPVNESPTAPAIDVPSKAEPTVAASEPASPEPAPASSIKSAKSATGAGAKVKYEPLFPLRKPNPQAARNALAGQFSMTMRNLPAQMLLDTPLFQAFDIRCNVEELREANIDLTQPVDVSVSKARVSEVLNAIVEPLGAKAEFNGHVVTLRPRAGGPRTKSNSSRTSGASGGSGQARINGGSTQGAGQGGGGVRGGGFSGGGFGGGATVGGGFGGGRTVGGGTGGGKTAGGGFGGGATSGGGFGGGATTGGGAGGGTVSGAGKGGGK
jgi:hypothetical protein